MEIKPLRADLKKYVEQHNLFEKWAKAKRLLKEDIRYPSLRVELLEPHSHGIYSFRLDKKYRALFFITDGRAEVFQITKHYKKN